MKNGQNPTQRPNLLARITEQLRASHWNRRRLALTVALATLLALPLVYRSRDSEVTAQNPMGDAATAAVADTDGPPAEPTVSEAQPSEPQAGPASRAALGSSATESAACLAQLEERITTAAEALRADSATRRPGAGRDPIAAEKHGWYPTMPAFREGGILPCARIVAYYGHPKSSRMGALGEFPKDEMLRRFRAQVAEWRQADPATPVVPALHMVSVVAQGEPGTSGRYRTITADSVVERIYGWAKEEGGIFIVDIQVGQDDIRNILPRFDWILKNPDVHLAVDPEFYMRDGIKPGAKIGTMMASDINYVSEHLAKLVNEHGLPPKVLIIHRFTRNMVQNYRDIRLRPEVSLVMHMDGWGAPWLKYDSFADYVVEEPVQFVGWKNFYHNDTKKGDPLVTPAQLVQLHPVPLYIQYQ